MITSNLLLFTAFAISTVVDLFIICVVFFLFYKIYKTKNITLENNREIYEHDKMFADIQEELEEIKHG